MTSIEEARMELKRLANIFEEGELKATAKLVGNLGDSIPDTLNELNEKYLEVLRTFQKEYVTDSSKKELFDHIVDMVVSGVLAKKGELKDKLLELSPLFEAMKETALNIEAISSVFLKTQNIKERFLGSCLLYLLKVEGEFDDAVRLLYVLKMADQGQDLSLTDVYNMSLWRLRRELNNLGITNLLFRGWEDNHLRNAIAHAHLIYDENAGRMTFTDIDPTTGKETYRKSLDLAEFSEYALAIDEVGSLFMRLMILLRIRDLIIVTSRNKKVTHF